ncbi:hypothetical protein L218DRAFT_78749 [Marasmius fiardii PR-910]|nr:hypothetical protein L218DRAFT_78749 [Marasmius fiardii PR-910]
MSHNSKAKAKGISATSFFDLKAEIVKQEEESARNKIAGKSTAIIGGVPRPGKKTTIWARTNKGVRERNSRDLELDAASKRTLESSKAILERKAKIYDKLSRGKTGGLSDAQVGGLLVDFDSKGVADRWESGSDDVDESSQPPMDANDDTVDYTDDFGRTRTVLRSEVPREFLKEKGDHNDEKDDESIIIRNPINHLPVYVPDADRVAQIEKDHAESNNPLNVHYDRSKEVRTTGAGFYNFSADEETRRGQMEGLKEARKETVKARADAGAVDVRPGEVEGMVGEGQAGTAKSRAMEKRKRELEERRKKVDAKRKKVKPADDVSQSKSEVQSPAQMFGATAPDPSATLESSNEEKKESKSKDKAPNEADAFLTRLESEIMKRKGK